MTDMRSNAKQFNQSTKSKLGRRIFLYGAAAVPMLCLTGITPVQSSGSRPFLTRVIQSGHSLTDPIVPVLDTMVAVANQHENRGQMIDRSTIPGSPMEWRWNHRTDVPDARHDIADYEVLVITERVSLSNTVLWHHSECMALRWFIHAWTEGDSGLGAVTLLYATWVDTDSGPGFDNSYNDPEGHLMFRERLTLEMARWQDIADYVNANRPKGSPPMRIIPGPLIMAAVYDAIDAKQAPGLNRIEDLFSDKIHLNAQGAYLIALAHFAVIYDYDPRNILSGLPRIEEPNYDTATWMKQLVHDVLLGYSDSGYRGAG